MPRLLAVLLLLLVAPAADAATGPCRVDVDGGPRCHVWTGKVTNVADGDGLYADVRGDGTRRPLLVRMTGIQAMELSRYAHSPRNRRGACHAREATAALERLVDRADGRVRLAAMNLERTDLGRRHRRHVALRIGGRWVDAGLELLERGHVLWLPNHGENAWNQVYGDAAQRGALTGANLFDPGFCGAGPAGDLELRVNYDAEGNDAENVNGEWVTVTNRGTAPADLGGWWIRDSALRRATFPAGVTIAPGDSIRLHVGDGDGRDGRSFFWGLPRPAFENRGDGGYLFDPQGDLRAFHIYG